MRWFWKRKKNSELKDGHFFHFEVKKGEVWVYSNMPQFKGMAGKFVGGFKLSYQMKGAKKLDVEI